MTQYVPIILAAGLLAFLATPLTRILARRVGMVDQPGLRKAHRLPVPLLGGLAIYLAVALAFVAFGNRDWLAKGIGILGGGTLLFLTGLWDDRFGMPARFKLAAQAVAAIFAMSFGVQVHVLGWWPADALLTLLWIVGITNAVNLMDNMDGLAAGITAVAAVGFFVLAALEGQGLVASLAAALFGASLGFLFYNMPPAISFMGDAGALTLGFMLAMLGIEIRFVRLPLGSTWMAPIVVLGMLIFDTTLVTVSRLRRGRSPFQGGSDHTSHRLAQLGLGQARAVLALYVLAAALSGLALWLTRLPPAAATAIFAGLLALALAALVLLERVEPRLSGDPPIVLVPGGGGLAEAVRAVMPLSREVLLLLAPAGVAGSVRPTRAEVVEAVAALAEHPAEARPLLERGLSEQWWESLNDLNRALRLNGVVWALPAGAEAAGAATPGPEVAAALRRARLIVLGPGDPAINLLPAVQAQGLAEALQASRAPRVWAGPSGNGHAQLEAALGQPVPAAGAPARLQATLQAQLLKQAAGQAKSQLPRQPDSANNKSGR